MDKRIQEFIDYLTDIETTSEISFTQHIQQNNDIFQLEYRDDFERVLHSKLQQWNIILPTEQDTQILTTIDSYSGGYHSIEQSNTDDDRIRQCERILELLHYCQQHYDHLANLYFRTLHQFYNSDNEDIGTVALQQIVSHLSENLDNDNERKCLQECLSLNRPVFSIPQSHQFLLATIETLLSTHNTEQNMIEILSLNNVDMLYPYRAKFLDVRREFRDSVYYFIDGDSLLLSVTHHINVDLTSYHGNTLHIIFIIERILLNFYQYSNQCNYTFVFFDCHYHLYQQESAILCLVRACLIAHLSKNADQFGRTKLRLFLSWLNDDYLQFAREEKPMFIFYHDMSSFDVENDKLLSRDTLQRLLIIYRLFGNYHQYTIQCHLFLMNKLILTDGTIKCFQIYFNKEISIDLLKKIIELKPNRLIVTGTNKNNQSKYEKLCQEIGESDIRLFLYIKTIIHFMQENEQQQYLMELLNPLLILHVALLIRLSLNDRHLPSSFSSITFSPTFSQFIVQFQHHLSSCLSSSSSGLSWSKVGDLFDGRLFAFTLYQIHQSSSNLRLDSKTFNIVKQSLDLLNIPFNDNIFQNIVTKLTQSDDLIFDSSLLEQQSTTRQTQKHRDITKISNPFIEKYLKQIFSSNTNSTINWIQPNERQISRYEGKYHWHVYKKVGDEIQFTRDGSQSTRDQKYYTHLTLYAESLKNADVKDYQPNIILPSNSSSALPDEDNNTNQPDSVTVSGGKKKEPNKGQSNEVELDKTTEAKKQNEQRLMENNIAEETRKIRDIKTRLKQISVDNYLERIDLINKNLSDFETPEIRLELLELKFDLQRKYLQILKKESSSTTEKLSSKLEFLQIDFFATMTQITDLKKIVDPFKENEIFMKELVDDLSLDHEKWYRFQLEKINSSLPRREQGAKDIRLPECIPDAWQLKFLNAVDKRESMIIVTPTSSGKTYASYYAMREVVNDKNDPDGIGICVYVAPTKALVNQVAATIYSDEKLGPVFGTFTRDYRVNEDKCRILVTVPPCFEILLLSSSSKCQQWCKRIRYCIFDEIHCMTGEDGADVWEKTMLLINCPMIGLSASVNNGKDLQQWIKNVEKQRSILFKTLEPRQVHFICHHDRLADLNKYLYSNKQLYPLHPVGLMNAKQLISRALPKDFSLSPSETLQLKNALEKNDAKNKQIPTLNGYFSPDWVIERNVCNEYSNLVCNQFKQLIENQQNSTIDAITESLNPFNLNEICYPESKPIPSLIVDFLKTLQEKNLLPCIVFCENRRLCEKMTESVAMYLEEFEREQRKTKYEKKIKAAEKHLLESEKSRRRAGDKPSGRRNNKDNDTDVANLKMHEEDLSNQTQLYGHEYKLLYGILDEGTLSNQRGIDSKIVDQLLEQASWNHPQLVKYMKRGVAYHHAGLNNKGRVAVEALFRTRYVQLVFSTSTLAMGINMPTKTVAFIDDSIFLDALNYRQSSGRAGRRGFDIQGNIIFINIPVSKIRHLIVSAIPNIQAHFPTSVTFFMRLLHLYSNAEDKKDAMNRSLIALRYPFISQSPHKHDLIDIQTQYHCLHTLDFLHRLNLINGNGELVGLAGLVTHLHYHEPANILLIYLMSTRIFHESDDIEIVNILARLFTNRLWLKTRQQHDILASMRLEHKFNSKLVLPSLSTDFSECVQSYNSIVKDVYGFYIENVSQQMRSFYDYQEHILPFSNVSFIQPSDYDNGTFEYHLHHHYSQQSHHPSISPFAAPSGLTHEQFMSNYNSSIGSWDLAYDLDLSTRIIPFVDIDARDHTNSNYYLNSYALDFFEHGSQKSLIVENEIGAGDVHDLLYDFLLMLSVIKTSLEIIISNEDKQTTDNDLNFFEPLCKKISSVKNTFSDKFYKQYTYRNRI